MQTLARGVGRGVVLGLLTASLVACSAPVEDTHPTAAQPVTVSAPIVLPPTQGPPLFVRSFRLVPTAGGWQFAWLGGANGHTHTNHTTVLSADWSAPSPASLLNAYTAANPIGGMDIASDGTRAYAVFAPGPQITRLGTHGAPLDTSNTLGPLSPSNVSSVAASAYDGGAFTAWSVRRSPSAFDLRLAAMSASGTVLTPGGVEVTVGTPSERSVGQLATACIGTRCAVMWSERGPLLLRRWSPTEGFVDDTPREAASNITPRAFLTHDGTHFVVLMVTYAYPTTRIEARRLAATGTDWEGPARVLFEARSTQGVQPILSIESVARDAEQIGMLVRTQGFPDTWTLLRVGTDGTLLGAAQTLTPLTGLGPVQTALVRTPARWSVLTIGDQNRLNVRVFDNTGSTQERAGDFTLLPPSRRVVYGLSPALHVGTDEGYRVFQTNNTLSGLMPWSPDFVRAAGTGAPLAPVALLSTGTQALLVTRGRVGGQDALVYSVPSLPSDPGSSIPLPTTTIPFDGPASIAEAVSGTPGGYAFAIAGASGLKVRSIYANPITTVTLPGDTRSLGLALTADATFVARDVLGTPGDLATCTLQLHRIATNGTVTATTPWPLPCEPGANLPMATNGTTVVVARGPRVQFVSSSLVLGSTVTLPTGEVVALGWNGTHFLALTRTAYGPGAAALYLWRLTPTGERFDTEGTFVALSSDEDLAGRTTRERPALGTNAQRTGVLYRRARCEGDDEVVLRTIDMTGPAVTTPTAVVSTGCVAFPMADAGAVVDVPTATTDGGADVAVVDAGSDTGVDVGNDTGNDVGVDVGNDTGNDVGVDVGNDIGFDTGPMVMLDAGAPDVQPVDTGAVDSGVDAPTVVDVQPLDVPATSDASVVDVPADVTTDDVVLDASTVDVPAPTDTTSADVSEVDAPAVVDAPVAVDAVRDAPPATDQGAPATDVPVDVTTPLPPPPNADGCGCHTRPTRTAPTVALVALLGLALVRRRRRAP